MIVRFKFLHKNYIALTIWPFIFVKNTKLKQDKILINHEKIHLRQQIELLWLPFFIWYFLEFSIKWIKYRNWNIAYRAISFEREAYQHETNLNYLKTRKAWHFWKYVRIESGK